MKQRDAKTFVDSTIQPSGNLSSPTSYIHWMVGDHSCTLDGEFTFEELRLLADHMAKHPVTEPWDDAIETWMRAHSQEHIDPKTGELNCTKLVEAYAHALGHDEWLDQPHHDVWDIALEFDPRVM